MHSLGLDKITLRNLKIKNIDYKRLGQYSNVKINYGNRELYYPFYFVDNENAVSSIIIEDNEKFLDLKLGINKVGTIKTVIYSKLTLCVKFLTGDNKKSLSTGSYNNYLHCVLTYIKEKYGITLLIDNNVVFDTMEIAYTIPMIISKISFLHMAKLFMSLLPRTFKEEKSYNDVENCITSDLHGKIHSQTSLPHAVERENNSIGFIIYVKSDIEMWKLSHRENVTSKHEHLIRFEIRLKSSQKIKAFLGSDKFNEITDPMISNAFWRFFEKNIIKKWTDWKKSTGQKISSLINENQQNHKSRWIDFFISEMDSISWKKGIPFIIDISQIEEMIPPNKSCYRNRSRTIKSLRQRMKDTGHDFLFSNDIRMIEELFEDLEKNVLQHCR